MNLRTKVRTLDELNDAGFKRMKNINLSLYKIDGDVMAIYYYLGKHDNVDIFEEAYYGDKKYVENLFTLDKSDDDKCAEWDL